MAGYLEYKKRSTIRITGKKSRLFFVEQKKMATQCNNNLKKTPFTSYRDPDTGEWVVKKS